MILIIDNRDSFVFNLAQTLMALGAEVTVARSESLEWREILELEPSGIVIGPGPGKPAEAGCSEDVLRHVAGAVPTLGVCLGHQALATAYGGRVVRSAELVHGKTRSVEHDGRGVFSGLPSPLAFTRYNSLTVEEASLPGELEISARGPNGEIMGLRHAVHPIEGVQFHPESVLCIDKGGRRLLENFLGSTACSPT